MARANPIEIQKYLKGIDYPARKQDIVDWARDEGADEQICAVLEQLPDEEYDSPTAVSEAIGELNDEE